MSTKQTNLTINATDPNNKKVSNTISYVNPNLNNATALEFAKKINGLTKNSYLSTEKVDKIELDTAILNQRNPIIKVGGIDYTTGTIRVPVSAMTANNGLVVVVGTQVPDYLLEVMPYFTDITSPDNPVVNPSRVIQGYSSSQNVSREIDFTEKKAFNFSFTVNFIAGNGFDAFSKTYDVEVYDDSE